MEMDSFDDRSREELIEEINRLKSHVNQLRNVIAKSNGTCGEGSERSKKEGRRQLDFNLFKKRKVLFQIAYFGWDYNGFTVQEDTPRTIEHELFRALKTTRLIEQRETSNYHRCGRTDKGVSAFRQVISIEVRTNLLEGEGVFDYPGCRANERPRSDEEINFCKILNCNLPSFIQVIGWAPLINRDFSARFDCKMRNYKYFFPLGSIKSLSDMNDAGARLVGSHDFRNFCKMDVGNGVVEYVRYISKVEASFVHQESPNRSSPYDLCVLNIYGNAFLWHQIRCIVSILFRVGQGLEKPSVINELLDIERNPRRPQYGLSSEIPLNLFDCDYEGVKWEYDTESLKQTIEKFQGLWTEHAVKAEMLRTSLRVIEEDKLRSGEIVQEQSNSLLPKSKARKYTPLMHMLKCPSLEEKIHTASKRMKRK